MTRACWSRAAGLTLGCALALATLGGCEKKPETPPAGAGGTGRGPLPERTFTNTSPTNPERKEATKPTKAAVLERGNGDLGDADFGVKKNVSM